jgi:hypothetical protein
VIDLSSDPIIIEAIGDSPNLRVLCFFLEHPIHDFTSEQLSEYLEMDKKELHKWLDKFLEMKFIELNKDKYRTRVSSWMFTCVSDFNECLGNNIMCDMGVFPESDRKPKPKAKVKKSKKIKVMH